MSGHRFPCLSTSIPLFSPPLQVYPPPIFPFPTVSLPLSFPPSLSTPLRSHPPHLSPSAHRSLYPSASFPQYHPLLRSVTLKLESQLLPPPHALVSPLDGCFCPLPRLREERKGEGDGFRRIYREFLSPSATPLPYFQLS